MLSLCQAGRLTPRARGGAQVATQPRPQMEAFVEEDEDEGEDETPI
jgi:hypothetical protein